MNHESKTPHPLPETARDAAILHALSRKPVVAIPEDFAARLAEQVRLQPQVSQKPWIGWGPRLVLGSGLLLTASLFALAPHAAPTLSNLAFDAELLLLAELGGLLLFAQTLLSRD